jgi:acetoin utilization deacetylase AcuC-like enzyme
LETSDYDWMTRRVMDMADHYCQGRVVSVLEGGYELDALAASVRTHVALLMGGEADE